MDRRETQRGKGSKKGDEGGREVRACQVSRAARAWGFEPISGQTPPRPEFTREEPN